MNMDSLDIKTFASRKELGEAAASRVSRKIGELLEDQAYVNIIFAAAPSQLEFLAALREAPIDWSRVRAFHMDEYIGLKADALQGFGNFLREHLFDRVPLLATHFIDGQAASPEIECVRYSGLLRQYPPDIVCMGIGENGHLAFNDPPVANFKDPHAVKIVALDLACRRQQVNDGCFPELRQVPRQAITLTIPMLMSAPHIYCVVPGKRKAPAVFNTLHQPIIEDYPSSVLRRHPHAELFLDMQSAERIAF
jgi:glucosamine-6-phosphate deaminase